MSDDQVSLWWVQRFARGMWTWIYIVICAVSVLWSSLAWRRRIFNYIITITSHRYTDGWHGCRNGWGLKLSITCVDCDQEQKDWIQFVNVDKRDARAASNIKKQLKIAPIFYICTHIDRGVLHCATYQSGCCHNSSNDIWWTEMVVHMHYRITQHFKALLYEGGEEELRGLWGNDYGRDQRGGREGDGGWWRRALYWLRCVLFM